MGTSDFLDIDAHYAYVGEPHEPALGERRPAREGGPAPACCRCRVLEAEVAELRAELGAERRAQEAAAHALECERADWRERLSRAEAALSSAEVARGDAEE